MRNQTDWIGATLSQERYLIHSVLGAGGMGTVYLAEDRTLEQQVVVKMPHPFLLRDQATQTRFLREVRALVELPHAHIVRIMDVGEVSETPYLVMQYLAGGSLEQLLPQLQQASAERRVASLTRWLPQIASALDYVHSQGVIHRDLKPANILFDESWNPFLSDFGIARRLAEDASREKGLTGTGMVLGSQGYMPLEMLVGKPVDARADQFSLAVMVYESLVGSRPFAGETAGECAVNMTSHTPAALDGFSASIPPALDGAVQRGLARSADDRFSSCGALASAVLDSVKLATDTTREKTVPVTATSSVGQHVAPSPEVVIFKQLFLDGGETTQGRPAARRATRAQGAGLRSGRLGRVLRGIGTHPWGEKIRQTPRSVWVSVVLAVLVIPLTIGYGINRYRVAGEKTVAPEKGPSTPRTPTPTPGEPPSAPGDDVPLPPPEPPPGEPSRGPAAPDPDVTRLIQNAIARLQDSGEGETRLEEAIALLDEALKSAPNNRDAYFWRAYGKLLVVEAGAAGPGVEARLQSTAEAGLADVEKCIALDVKLAEAHWLRGRLLARSEIGSYDSAVEAMQAARVFGSQDEEQELHLGLFDSVEELRSDAMARGNAAWAEGLKATLGLRTIPSTKVDEETLLQIRVGNSSPKDYPYRPIYKLIGDIPTGCTIDSTTGVIDWVPTEAQGPRQYGLTVGVGVESSPPLFDVAPVELQNVVRETENGWWYPIDEETFQVTVHEVNRPPRVVTLTGHTHTVYSVAFSPDGQRIVSGSTDATLKIWDANSGEELQTLTGHSSYVYSVAFSPDGQRIVSGSRDQTLKVWDAKSGEELQTLTGHDGYVMSVAFSPDSQRIASGSYDGSVKIWDAKSGEELQTFTGHDGYVSSVAFSPDGQRIVSASYDGGVKIWDANSGEELQTLTGHAGKVFSVAFSPDGQRIVSGSEDKSLKIWDANSGEELQTLTGHAGSVHCVAFSPDGQLIVSGGKDKTLKIWDANSGEELHTLTGKKTYTRYTIIEVAFSPDGQRIVSGSTDKTLKIWDVGDFFEALNAIQAKAAPVAAGKPKPEVVTQPATENSEPGVPESTAEEAVTSGLDPATERLAQLNTIVFSLESSIGQANSKYNIMVQRAAIESAKKLNLQIVASSPNVLYLKFEVTSVGNFYQVSLAARLKGPEDAFESENAADWTRQEVLGKFKASLIKGDSVPAKLRTKVTGFFRRFELDVREFKDRGQGN